LYKIFKPPREGGLKDMGGENSKKGIWEGESKDFGKSIWWDKRIGLHIQLENCRGEEK